MSADGGSGGKLEGKVVVLTRALEDAEPLRTRLLEQGATVRFFPCICVEFLEESPQIREALEVLAAGRAGWVAFSSRNGVRGFSTLLGGDRLESFAATKSPRLAAIGPGTAAELERLVRPPDLVADRSVAEGLASSLLEVATPEMGEILLPGAREGRRVLRDRLEKEGFFVRAFAVYETCMVSSVTGSRDGSHQLALEEDVDFVVFTSPSTVRGFFGSAALPFGAVAVSIGPSTSKALASRGAPRIREARSHDLEGLVAALYDHG